MNKQNKILREDNNSSLDTGGSIGSIKGNFFEKHFATVLIRLGFKIVSTTDYLKYKDDKIITYHKYRTRQDQFTEIDFYIPHKKIGFWVTNIGQAGRYKYNSSSKKLNEFIDLIGLCPHCKTNKLPNNKADVIDKWTCENCKKIVYPFDLSSKESTDGKEITGYINKSAIMQAHKQAYYRIGEYIEAKTSDDDFSCIEIIYNKKTEWRNWYNAIDLFFDDSIFVFDEFNGFFGSDDFENAFLNRIRKILISPPKPNQLINKLINKANLKRKSKTSKYMNWISEIRESRKNLWRADEPTSFPIRYSIYGLLKSNGKIHREYDAYAYAVLIKTKSNKLNLSSISSKEKNLIPTLINKKYITRDLKEITEQGLEYLNFCIKGYKKVLKTIINNNLKRLNSKDFWYNNHKNLIIDLLEDLLKQSLKNDWYKFVMIAAYDYIKLNETPYINQQFEPLETLTYIILNEFKKEGIIKEVYGEPGIDKYEKTFLSDFPFAKTGDFILGTDVTIKLNNGKRVYIQCKSNTAFKKWDENPKNIKNSGIPYKDSKRMVAHNFLSSFSYKEEKLIYDSNRIYIGIIDGNWCSSKKDIYKIIKLMYFLGVDEIFFADEFETRLKQFLIDNGN